MKKMKQMKNHLNTNANLFFVTNFVRRRLVPKLAAVDIFDGETTEPLLACREPEASSKKNFVMYGGDTNLAILTTAGDPVGGISRNSSAFKLGNLYFLDETGQPIGSLKKALVGNKFHLITEDKVVLHKFTIVNAFNKYKVKIDGASGFTYFRKWKGATKRFFKQEKCFAAFALD